MLSIAFLVCSLTAWALAYVSSEALHSVAFEPTRKHRQLGEAQQPLKRAYVTLLYSNFVAGTRALGRSLLDSGTKADLVVLVTPDVVRSTRNVLEKDGWRIQPVTVTENPNAGFQSRLVFVYTKLLIFNMVEYDRIVFLDSDTLILENIDELFDCEPFCAVMRHSELLNSGVLALSPNAELYTAMTKQFDTLPSYTGGDQGFLNSYYGDFAACPLFEPFAAAHQNQQRRSLLSTNVSTAYDELSGPLSHPSAVREQQSARALAAKDEPSSSTARGGCWRLPSRYNGDWPLLFVDGAIQRTQHSLQHSSRSAEWVRLKKVKILHFTFGTAKPWMWWTYPFLPYVDTWVATYARLAPQGGLLPPQQAPPLLLSLLHTLLLACAPAAAAAALYRLARRSAAVRRAASAAAAAVAAAAVPACALRAGSLLGNCCCCVVGAVLLLAGLAAAFVAAGALVATPAAAVRTCAVALLWGVTLFAAAAAAALHVVYVKGGAVQREQRAATIAAAAATAGDYDSSDGENDSLRAAHSRGRRTRPSRSAASLLLPFSVAAPAALTDSSAAKVAHSICWRMCCAIDSSSSSSSTRASPLRETLWHAAALLLQLALLLSCGHLRGLQQLPLSSLISTGVTLIGGLLAFCMWSFVRLPVLWGQYGAAAAADRLTAAAAATSSAGVDGSGSSSSTSKVARRAV